MLQISPICPIILTHPWPWNHTGNFDPSVAPESRSLKSWSFHIIPSASCCHKQHLEAPHPPWGFFKSMSPSPDFSAEPRKRAHDQPHGREDSVGVHRKQWAFFLLATQTPIESFPPHPIPKGWKGAPINQGQPHSNQLMSSTSVKGSCGLNLSLEAFPSKLQLRRSKIHLGSW